MRLGLGLSLPPGFRGAGEIIAPAVADQSVLFGRLTLAGAGGIEPTNTGGSATWSITTDDATNPGHWDIDASTGRLTPSVAGAGSLVASYSLVVAATNAGGSDTATITIPTEANTYSIRDATELADWIALGVATVSGSTVKMRPGDYAWLNATLNNRFFTSLTTITSHDENDRAQFLSRGQLRVPTNLRFYRVKFFAEFIVPDDVTGNATGPSLPVIGIPDNFQVEECKLYSNLLEIFDALPKPIPDITHYTWRGILGLDGTTEVGPGGYHLINNEIHGSWRLMNIPRGDSGPVICRGNDCYDFGVDALLFGGINPGSYIGWNRIHKVLKSPGDLAHNDAVQFVANRFTSDVTIVGNVADASRDDGRPTAVDMQGIFMEDISSVIVQQDFNPDPGGVKGTGWTVSNGVAVFSGGAANSVFAFNQNTTLQNTLTYTCSLEINALTNPVGNIIIRVVRAAGGDNNEQSFALSSLSFNDIIQFDFTPIDTATDFEFQIEATDAAAEFTCDDAWITIERNYTNINIAGNLLRGVSAHGISLYNPIDCNIVNNTVVINTDWSTNPSVFMTVGTRQHRRGDGSGNIVADNATKGLALFEATGINNVLIDALTTSNADSYDQLFVGPDFQAPDTVDEFIAAFQTKVAGLLDTAVPKAGAATDYVDYVNRLADIPRLNHVAAFTFTDLTAQPTSTLVTSLPVQIIDIDAFDHDGAITTSSVVGALVQVSGDGTPEFRITSDAGGTMIVTDWTSTPAIIEQGEHLWLRATTSASGATAHNILVQVGAQSDTWTITTA